MNERNLPDELDRILSDRLREIPSKYSNGPWDAIRLGARSVRKRLGGKRQAGPESPWQWEIIARVRSLPAHMQDALRRHLVFQEAEESICFSLNLTAASFRRFLREAADYTLMREERMPELRVKRRPGR